MEKIIYCFWTGNNPMSSQRKRCLDTMSRSGCKVVLITPKNLYEYVLTKHPLHPAYEYLSLTHKADYLRCYFMHHYGGGYSDIKETSASWESAFDDMDNNKVFINGYQEIGPEGVAKANGLLYNELARNYKSLIGLGCFICKPYTPITSEWIDSLHARLDVQYEVLKTNPATYPQDHKNVVLDYGLHKYQVLLIKIYNKLFRKNYRRSKYPLGWSEILSEIFHPICLKYKDNIKQTVPRPLFVGYR
jgi:hypothetical protein